MFNRFDHHREKSVMQERRRNPRYRLDAEITVENDAGRTIDVSANSVYFEVSRRYPPGATLSLVFPFEHAGPGSTVKCAAQVVRIEDRGDGLFGIAATYEPVDFSAPA
jgi:hypothetical protein